MHPDSHVAILRRWCWIDSGLPALLGFLVRGLGLQIQGSRTQASACWDAGGLVLVA